MMEFDVFMTSKELYNPQSSVKKLLFPPSKDLPLELRDIPALLIDDMKTMVRKVLAEESTFASTPERSNSTPTSVLRMTDESTAFLRQYVRYVLAHKLQISPEVAALSLVSMSDGKDVGFEREKSKLESNTTIRDLASKLQSFLRRVSSVSLSEEKTEQPKSVVPTTQKMSASKELMRLQQLQCSEESFFLAKAMMSTSDEEREKFLKRIAIIRFTGTGTRAEVDQELLEAVRTAPRTSIVVAFCARIVGQRAKSSDLARVTRISAAKEAIKIYEEALMIGDEYSEKITASSNKDREALQKLISELERKRS